MQKLRTSFVTSHNVVDNCYDRPHLRKRALSGQGSSMIILRDKEFLPKWLVNSSWYLSGVDVK